MSSIRRIIWVLPHPTPYNVYLLNGLARRLSVPSEAVYRWPVLPNHPWSRLPDRNFPWRNAAVPGRRDRALEREAAREAATLFIFAGWRDRTIFPLVLRRWWKRLPYAFWSDTPKISGGLTRRAVNAAQRFFTRRASALLATGTPAVENYAAMGIPRAKLRDFPFIVDPQHFGNAVAIRAERKPSRPVTFVIPARLFDHLKGQTVAIRALAAAKARVPHIPLRLIIAGTGPDLDTLRDYATEQKVNHETIFHGWVEYEEMPSLLGAADALVLPSRWDPFPVTVIEAMAAGLPVLGSSACGSVQERVVDGVNGFTHPAGDSETLAEQMAAIASSGELRATLEKNALAASHLYGIDRAADTIRALLRDVESSRRTA